MDDTEAFSLSLISSSGVNQLMHHDDTQGTL